MTNVAELKEALKETLEERGVLNQIRAIMRQNIFEAIESDDKPKPKISNENLIINELIKEYLIYNNYLHSASVFEAETGQPKEALGRDFIAKELNIQETIYSMLFGLKKETYVPVEREILSQSGENKEAEVEKKAWDLDLKGKDMA